LPNWKTILPFSTKRSTALLSPLSGMVTRFIVEVLVLLLLVVGLQTTPAEAQTPWLSCPGGLVYDSMAVTSLLGGLYCGVALDVVVDITLVQYGYLPVTASWNCTAYSTSSPCTSTCYTLGTTDPVRFFHPKTSGNLGKKNDNTKKKKW